MQNQKPVGSPVINATVIAALIACIGSVTAALIGVGGPLLARLIPATQSESSVRVVTATRSILETPQTGLSSPATTMADSTPTTAAPTLAVTLTNTPPAPPLQVDALLGSWRNVDAKTKDITRIDIQRQGERLIFHLWAACAKKDCDWGQQEVAVSQAQAGVIQLTWVQSGVQTVRQEITLTTDHRLQITNHWFGPNNTSETPDRDSTNFFERSKH